MYIDIWLQKLYNIFYATFKKIKGEKMKELDRKLNNAFDIINFRAYVYFLLFP